MINDSDAPNQIGCDAESWRMQDDGWMFPSQCRDFVAISMALAFCRLELFAAIMVGIYCIGVLNIYSIFNYCAHTYYCAPMYKFDNAADRNGYEHSHAATSIIILISKRRPSSV